MKRIYTTLILLLSIASGGAQELMVSGARAAEPVQVPGQKLFLYVLLPDETPERVTFSLPLSGTGQQLMSYTHGAASATPVADARIEGGKVVWTTDDWSRTYFLSPASGTNTYYRFFDYRAATPQDMTLSAAPSTADPCQWIQLTLTPTPAAFTYYTPTGEQQTLSRDWQVRYNDLQYSAETTSYAPYTNLQTVENFSADATYLTASLADTPYSLVGDRFSQALGIKEPFPIQSEYVETQRLEGVALYEVVQEVSAEPGEETNTSEQTIQGELSAPVTLRLRIVANEPAAASYLWRITQGSSPGAEAPLVMQFAAPQTEYTFTQAGSFYISASIGNRTASCTLDLEGQPLTIGASKLEVPNAFSPFSSEGVNDLFRVVHQSIVTFQAGVFDEYGNALYRWSDPNGGWDGTYNGRPCPPGVYYYVISARGADGKEYNLSGALHLMVGMDMQQVNP